MSASSYSAIILAAGFSSRMERFKPLLKIGDESACGRLVRLYREKGMEIILVTGWQKEKLESAVSGAEVKFVENPDYARGMFTSVVAGLRHIRPGGRRAVFVHPVDIPLVRPYTLQRLIDAAESNPGSILYPVCAAGRGHPAVLPVSIIDAVLAWKGEGGLKGALENSGGPAVEIPVPDDFIHLDMDTPEDYRLLLERYRSYRVPSPEESEILYDMYNVAPDRRRHCRRVTEIALSLAEALSAKGQRPDIEAVRAGALLHDMVKGQKDHAGLGGRLLREMGFDAVAGIVAAHSDLPDGIDASSLEAKIVFLADKFVAGEDRCSLEQRYQRSLERFGQDPGVRENILQRRAVAFGVKQEFETILESPLEEIIQAGQQTESDSN